MAYLIGMIAFGGLAVAVLILWDRLGRLEFEVKRLHAAIQEARGAADEEPAGPTAMAATAATSRQPLLPLEPPSESHSSTAPPPEPTVARLMPERDAVPAAATGVKDQQKPAAIESHAAERVAPIAADTASPTPDRAARGLGFEQLFGARLAVWGGGIALAMAGFFLVKYSVEIGLITPPVRMILGGLFGLLLLAAAEFVHRRPGIANGARIAQSLAGAGIAVLYAVLYITTSIYGLIPDFVGFLGLSAVTALALLLSLRRGPPIALMGLIGGFATPAMVSAEAPNVPVLMLYLFLVIGGLMLLIRRQGWWWLAIPAALGGFGWVGLILTSDIAAENSIWLGLFLLAMTGMVFATSTQDRRMPLGQMLCSVRALMPILTGGVALAQLAVTVGIAGFAWMDWGLFALLAAGCVVLGARIANCALLPPIALTVALTLLALWPAPDTLRFTVMAAVFLALFAGAGYWLTWRSDRSYLWLGQAIAATLGVFAIAYVRLFPEPSTLATDLAWAGLALVLTAPALVTAAVAQSRRKDIASTADRLLLMAGGTVATLVAAALLLAVPAEHLPLAFALQALATVMIANRMGADILNWIANAAGVLFAVTLFTAPGGAAIEAMFRLFGAFVPSASAWILVLPIAPLAAVACLTSWRSQRLGFAWAGVASATLALAVIVDLSLLPFALAVEGLVLMLLARRYAGFGLFAQSVTAAGLSVWQTAELLVPLAAAAAPSLAGQPVYTADLPALRDVAIILALPALPLVAMAWFCPPGRDRRWRVALSAAAAVAVATLGYVAVKTLFGIEGPVEFVQRGFFERAIITQSLFALGAAAFWTGSRVRQGAIVRAGLILTAAALARLIWFDLLVFNPMLTTQNVGGWPVLNGLLPAYGLPILWLAAFQRLRLPELMRLLPVAKALSLALILVLALALARQAFHGGLIIVGAVGTAELYTYSAVALATAVGFLLWGVVRSDQMVRMASLGLMLAAIAKVFLYDASALIGLWRIAAFAGLGICLLGISWLYGRYVFGDRRTATEAAQGHQAPDDLATEQG